MDQDIARWLEERNERKQWLIAFLDKMYFILPDGLYYCDNRFHAYLCDMLDDGEE